MGIPGEYPAAKDVPLSGGMTAERAPEAPSRGAGVGGHPAAPPVRPHPPLRGPVGYWVPSLVLLEQTPVWANKDEIP